MGLWSMIKGKDSQFKAPLAVGEVGVLITSLKSVAFSLLTIVFFPFFFT